MPKIIAVNRKLATVGRRLVTDANGAPCCCGRCVACPTNAPGRRCGYNPDAPLTVQWSLVGDFQAWDEAGTPHPIMSAVNLGGTAQIPPASACNIWTLFQQQPPGYARLRVIFSFYRMPLGGAAALMQSTPPVPFTNAQGETSHSLGWSFNAGNADFQMAGVFNGFQVPAFARRTELGTDYRMFHDMNVTIEQSAGQCPVRVRAAGNYEVRWLPGSRVIERGTGVSLTYTAGLCGLSGLDGCSDCGGGGTGGITL